MDDNNDNNNEVENVEEIEHIDDNVPGVEEISVTGETTDTLKISNEAIATYAGIAVSEVQGVYGMTGTLAGLQEALSGKKNLTKGIKVDVGEKNVKIDVNIIVEYGARIPEVAFEIQNKVKKSVENMTGLKVLEVNVHVQGVHTITEKDEPKQEEAKQEETENENTEENN